MNHYSKVGLAACCAVATLAVAVAQNAPPTPEQRAKNAVRLRQSVMEVQQFSYGPAAAMVRAQRTAPFDAAVVQKAATRLEITSGMVADSFKK